MTTAERDSVGARQTADYYCGFQSEFEAFFPVAQGGKEGKTRKQLEIRQPEKILGKLLTMIKNVNINMHSTIYQFSVKGSAI